MDEFVEVESNEIPPPYKTSKSRQHQKLAEDDVAMIAVMGATGSGKTTFINTVSNSSLLVGHDLRSCTSEVGRSQLFTLGGKKIILIDTPGFDDTERSDADVLQLIGDFLCATYMENKKLSGVIYLHRISDVRVGGVSARNFRMFRKLCGEKTMKNVAIITTRWDMVSSEDGERRENQLCNDELFIKPALDNKAQLSRYDNTAKTAQEIVGRMARNIPLPLRFQEEVVDEGKQLGETGAGDELGSGIAEQLRKHAEEMRKVREDMEDALKRRDKEEQEELEAERKKLYEVMEKMREDQKTLAQDYQAKLEELKNSNWWERVKKWWNTCDNVVCT